MKYFTLLILLGGCSLFRPGQDLSDTAQETPGWAYAPYEKCTEIEELCASGEGKSFKDADAEARNNLGSIFEVKIQSELNVTTSSAQTFPWQAQVREEVQKTIKESVDQVLEQVEIKARFKKAGLSYALAALDRSKASDLFGSRLNKIDQELDVLWKNHQRTNLRRIVKLFQERERLNERYAIVAGSAKPSPVSWQEIIQWRESKPKAEPLILKIGQAPDWMKEKVGELLTESGFRIVKGEANRVVVLQVDSIKEYLNVEGFEKYTFTLSLKSVVNGESRRSISSSETVSGRSQADALIKVKKQFVEYIEQHLSDLNLD